MGPGQGQERVELTRILGQLRSQYGRSDEDTAERVTNEGNAGDRLLEVADVVGDLIHQLISHFFQTQKSVELIDFGHEKVEICAGERNFQVGFHQP